MKTLIVVAMEAGGFKLCYSLYMYVKTNPSLVAIEIFTRLPQYFTYFKRTHHKLQVSACR